ncbi:MAG: hypothetical protein WCW16_01365 [Candidatus Magasanikbacteria bacterium]
MFETSKDLLYVVLSLSILWFTVFLCWLLYQAARTLRNINRITEILTNKLELISDAVEFIRKKVDSLTGHMGMVSGVLGQIVEKYVVGKLSSKLDERGEKKKAKKK